LYTGSTIRIESIERETSKSSAGLVYGMMNGGCVSVHAARTSTFRAASSSAPAAAPGAAPGRRVGGRSAALALGITCLSEASVPPSAATGPQSAQSVPSAQRTRTAAACGDLLRRPPPPPAGRGPSLSSGLPSSHLPSRAVAQVSEQSVAGVEESAAAALRRAARVDILGVSNTALTPGETSLGSCMHTSMQVM